MQDSLITLPPIKNRKSLETRGGMEMRNHVPRVRHAGPGEGGGVGQLWVLGRGKMGKATDVSSARQSRAQSQSISEQMASLVMTTRNGRRDSMSLRNNPSI